VGVIHAAALQAPQFDPITVGYLIIGGFLWLYPFVAPKEDLESRIIVPDEPDLMDETAPGRA
jgi:AGZA family xanthine/uracil permease-like MFS transporter